MLYRHDEIDSEGSDIEEGFLLLTLDSESDSENEDSIITANGFISHGSTE